MALLLPDSSPVKRTRGRKGKRPMRAATMEQVKALLKADLLPCYNDTYWGFDAGSGTTPIVTATASATTFFLSGIPIYQGGTATEKAPTERLSYRVKPTAIELRAQVRMTPGSGTLTSASARFLLVCFHQSDGVSFTLADVLQTVSPTFGAAPFASWNWQNKVKNKFRVLVDEMVGVTYGGQGPGRVNHMVKLSAPILYERDPMGGPGTSPADTVGDGYWLFIVGQDPSSPGVGLVSDGYVRLWFEDAV